jgi:hypothetical protein
LHRGRNAYERVSPFELNVTSTVERGRGKNFNHSWEQKKKKKKRTIATPLTGDGIAASLVRQSKPGVVDRDVQIVVTRVYNRRKLVSAKLSAVVKSAVRTAKGERNKAVGGDADDLRELSSASSRSNARVAASLNVDGPSKTGAAGSRGPRDDLAVVSVSTGGASAQFAGTSPLVGNRIALGNLDRDRRSCKEIIMCELRTQTKQGRPKLAWAPLEHPRSILASFKEENIEPLVSKMMDAAASSSSFSKVMAWLVA